MMEMLFKLVGGIGLFLMGMVMLTDGLKSFAGDSLRKALLRFTGRPIKSFMAGALVTLMVQSSSATTVAVIGFVSAGLLTFPQALGVIFGASLGTTGTGWIVSVLGLKVSVGFYALPLVGAGAFMNLLGSGRTRPLGVALAGFGLIFMGIETLQDAMQQLSTRINLAAVPSTGLLGHLLMMLIGIVLTLLMQSSSAAVATTLTALHTGSINFEQAASLVIGAAIGTTVTGALAAIGGSVAAKRTALAHVLFNLATGLIAIILLPVFLWLIGVAQRRLGLDPGATSLAAFHTGFIAVGVLIFLPFVDRFARRIERLLPEEGPEVTRHLDPTVMNIPAVALETTRRALRETAMELFTTLQKQLAEGGGVQDPGAAQRIRRALDQINEFFARIPAVNPGGNVSPLREAQIHAIEHLGRLIAFLHPPESVRGKINHPRLQAELASSQAILAGGAEGLAEGINGEWIKDLEHKSVALSVLRREERPAILREAAAGDWETQNALEMLDAMRWLDSIGYHVWRICNYLGGEASPESDPEPEQSHPLE
jgi:phosphate:Na+ symporter